MLGKINLIKATWSVTGLAGKVAFFAVASTIGVANVVGSAGADLNATAFNTSAQALDSGTLSLTLGNGNYGSASVGFGSYLTKLRPTDTINRFVDYTTGADMGWETPALTVAATGPSAAALGVNGILVDGTNGLKVWVQTCGTSTWATATTCTTGSPLNVVGTGTGASSVFLSTLIAGAQSMSNMVGTASAVNHLKYTISLPDKTETTANGNLSGTAAAPSASAISIQGKSVELVWTVTVDQTAATDTNA